MKKGRKFYASLLLFTAALCPLSGNPDFGTGPAKAAEATVSVPRELLATVKSGYVEATGRKHPGQTTILSTGKPAPAPTKSLPPSREL
ncbi:MAG: hypothetical protein ACLR2E_23720 [Lachnospiraceae bacterium]